MRRPLCTDNLKHPREVRVHFVKQQLLKLTCVPICIVSGRHLDIISQDTKRNVLPSR